MCPLLGDHTVRHSMKGKWSPFLNQITQSLPKSSTLVTTGRAHCRSRLGAVSHPVYRSNLSQPGLRGTDQEPPTAVDDSPAHRRELSTSSRFQTIASHTLRNSRFECPSSESVPLTLRELTPAGWNVQVLAWLIQSPVGDGDLKPVGAGWALLTLSRVAWAELTGR